MKFDECCAFLRANPGAADLFSRTIEHCRKAGSDSKLATECQDGLPVSTSDVSKLAEKFELAKSGEAAESEERRAEIERQQRGTEERRAEIERQQRGTEERRAEIERQQRGTNQKEFLEKIQSVRTRLAQYPDLAAKYETKLADLESGKLDPLKPEAKAFAREFLADIRQKLTSARTSNADTRQAEEDLRFFAAQFHSLGLIDGKELDAILRDAVPKPPLRGQADDARFRATEGFRKADADTFVAFDRKDAQGRAFDEIVRRHPDGSLSKTIVSPSSGYSLEIPVGNDVLPDVRQETELNEKLDDVNRRSARVAEWRYDLKDLEALREREKSGTALSEDESKRLDELSKFEKALKGRGIDGDAGLELLEKTQLEPARKDLEARLSELKARAAEGANRAPLARADREALGRDTIAFFDSIGLTDFRRSDVERLLERFTASKDACENGVPSDFETLLARKNDAAREFRQFVAERLGGAEGDYFDFSNVPPTLKRLKSDGTPLNLRSEFLVRGLCRDDGTIDWKKA